MAGKLATFAFGALIGIGLLYVLTSRSREAASSSATLLLTVADRASATPSVAADGETAVVAWGGALPDGSTDVFSAVSTDGGRTFGPPVRVNDVDGTARLSGEMAPRVAVRARGAQPSAIEVLWTARGSDGTTIRLSRSEDGGRTFAASRALQADGAAGDRGWAALAMGRDGRPRAVWLDHRAMADGAGTSGATGLHHGHEPAGEGAARTDGVEMARKSSIYYSDGSVERAIASGVCYCCKTALAVGATGRVFLAWRHVYAGNLRDIAFASSSPDGLSFTPPVRVSEDQWQIDGCPDDGPAVALGADDTVHLVWPTVVSQPRPHKAMFYASSRDGASFTSRMRVTAVERNVAHPQIAVARDRRVALLWDETVDGQRRVFLGGLGEGGITGPITVSSSQAASYPVAAFTGAGLVVAWTEGAPESSRIAVRVVDGQGQ